MKRQPINEVHWINPAQLRANDYNPNKVFTPEMELLEISLLEDGFTQPAVVMLDEGVIAPPTYRAAAAQALVQLLKQDELHSESPASFSVRVSERADRIISNALAEVTGVIVDGFHRWTLAQRSQSVRAMTGGFLPCVFLDDTKTLADRMLSTVRHNRARGQHGILAMGDIVRSLQSELTHEEIEQRCGMESEEIERLSELRGSPELRGKDSFGKGWVPTRAGKV